jgi:hypothetical protein
MKIDRIANVKGMVAKSMMLALAAGALMVASPVNAEAQHFAVGVRVANPYYAPRNDRYDRYEFERRQAEIRHEEWLRAHRFERFNGYR